MQRATLFFLTLLIVFWCVVRFIGLEQSPPGFYVDEAAGATNIICFAQDNTNESGEQFLLFTRGLGGGFFTPAYLYIGNVWVKLFGVSIASFRSIAAFFSVLTIWGVYLLAHLLAGKRAALLAALAASVSPWCFHFSRIAWDPPLMPCFLVFGAYFFLRSNRRSDGVLSAAFLVLAMYSYPTARVQVPLLFPGLAALKYARIGLTKTFAIPFVLFGVAVSLPLVILTVSGELQGRFGAFGIFSRPYLDSIGSSGSVVSLSVIFIENLLLHFHPRYLFLSGDTNLRHSTQAVGQLSWLDMLALCCALALICATILSKLKKEKGTQNLKEWPVLLLFSWGLLCGIVPAALTWEALPHALRSIGSWPFVSLLSGIVLWKTIEAWKYALPLTAVVAASFSYYYLTDYLREYPERSWAWFDSDVNRVALQTNRTGQWEGFIQRLQRYDQVAVRYYLIRYGGEGCSSSREQIEGYR